MDNLLENAPVWRAVRPSGAFQSTVLRSARWERALVEESPLSGVSLARMWSPVRLNDGTSHGYGLEGS